MNFILNFVFNYDWTDTAFISIEATKQYIRNTYVSTVDARKFLSFIELTCMYENLSFYLRFLNVFDFFLHSIDLEVDVSEIYRERIKNDVSFDKFICANSIGLLLANVPITAFNRLLKYFNRY